MKIERTSENQIRCTLNKHDLMERQLKISELAYGSDKAKELFRDIMEQANIDLGFDADDIPLMIEAIPTSRDSIKLIIRMNWMSVSPCLAHRMMPIPTTMIC